MTGRGYLSDLGAPGDSPLGGYLSDQASNAAGDEMKFQVWVRQTPWFREYVRDYGEEPNLSDPDYDYRAAWRAGLAPQRTGSGKYHWPDVTPQGGHLKSLSHPSYWMEDFMQKTGIDPDATVPAPLPDWRR